MDHHSFYDSSHHSWPTSLKFERNCCHFAHFDFLDIACFTKYFQDEIFQILGKDFIHSLSFSLVHSYVDRRRNKTICLWNFKHVRSRKSQLRIRLCSTNSFRSFPYPWTHSRFSWEGLLPPSKLKLKERKIDRFQRLCEQFPIER